MPRNMGIGRLGSPNLIFKHKYRWTMRIDNVCDGRGGKTSIPEHFVKLAARPNWSHEEVELNFLNARDWIPGKQTYETITVTYRDVATADNLPLFNWLAAVFEYPDPVTLRMGSTRGDYVGRGIITMYDGCGQELEQWVLDNMWPQAVNFGELDYATSEEATIELTLRYSSVVYRSLCPVFTPAGCCTPCGS